MEALLKIIDILEDVALILDRYPGADDDSVQTIWNKISDLERTVKDGI